MAKVTDWWKRLLGNKVGEDDYNLQIGDLRPVPSGQAAMRAEHALPGTNELTPIVKLAPPPVNPNLVDPPESDPKRDYAPSPIAEWSLIFEANEQFDCAALAKILRARHEEFCCPMHHVRTPDGQVTYLSSADAPSYGVALIPAWSLGEWANPDKDKIFAGAQLLETALAELPEGFQSPEISLEALGQQLDQASKISTIEPRSVQIVAHHPEGKFWDGREIWILLHKLGLEWGDMDCFQWTDPTDQTDYLILVEVDDDDLGYALPERIASGEQHFRAIKFSFDIARSPAPEHVLDQLEIMTALCQKELSCDLTAFLDEKAVISSEELRQGVLKVVKYLDSLGIEAGSDSVCQLI